MFTNIQPPLSVDAQPGQTPVRQPSGEAQAVDVTLPCCIARGKSRSACLRRAFSFSVALRNHMSQGQAGKFGSEATTSKKALGLPTPVTGFVN